MTFDLRQWLSSSVKVTFFFIIRWTFRCCVLVPSTKLVGSIEFEIWTIVWRTLKWRHNDVILHSIFIKFKYKSTKQLSNIPNFILSEHKRAEIQSREFNRELWRKMGSTSLWPWLWPKVTILNRVWASAVSNHLAKTASKSVHPFVCNFVHKQSRTDTLKFYWTYKLRTWK